MTKSYLKEQKNSSGLLESPGISYIHTRTSKDQQNGPLHRQDLLKTPTILLTSSGPLESPKGSHSLKHLFSILRRRRAHSSLCFLLFVYFSHVIQMFWKTRVTIFFFTRPTFFSHLNRVSAHLRVLFVFLCVTGTFRLLSLPAVARKTDFFWLMKSKNNHRPNNVAQI